MSRTLVTTGLLFSILVLGACMPIVTDDMAPVFPLSEPDYTNKRIRDLSAFEDALAAFPAERVQALDGVLTNATIPEIQTLLEAGDLTSVELATYYVDRIRRYDIDKLNSVMELNADALTDAAAADELRAEGAVFGPMHGIPVLLKDNIATGDGMHTTAGAYALKDWQPDRDAFLVQQLREAGAIILGKANLSEWANYMDAAMPSGFSVLGGQTRHPYGPFDPLGSSTGSAVAAAANLATVTVGSETSGSITAPSKTNSVVGLKTSHGLVSGDYVIPLVDWMDVPGPIGRSVTDVAILLTAMTGVDESTETDETLAEMQAVDFAQYASLDAAEGLTVAIPIYDDASLEAQVAFLTDLEIEVDDTQRAAISQELAVRTEQIRAVGGLIAGAGLNTVEVSAAGVPALNSALVLSVLEIGFQDSFDRFVSQAGGDFPVSSLAHVATVNNEDLANRAPYGQGYLEGSVNTEISAEDYAATKEPARVTTADALRAVLDESGAHVLLIDDSMVSYPVAGFPAITLPLGYLETGEPYGIRLTGDYLSEPQLISVAYAIEQATQARRAPDLDAVLESFAGLNLAVPEVE